MGLQPVLCFNSVKGTVLDKSVKYVVIAHRHRTMIYCFSSRDKRRKGEPVKEGQAADEFGAEIFVMQRTLSVQSDDQPGDLSAEI